MHRHNKAWRGYSIIELITIILILAILAVVMLPKFLDLKSDAKQSTRAQVVAALQQAVRLAQTKWELEGRPQGGNANNGPQVEYSPGLFVTVDRNTGWPVGDWRVDHVNNMNLRDCVQVFADLVESDFTIRHRGQVNNNTFDDFDIIITKVNSNPDICNYYWSDSIDSRPANNRAPNTGIGFQYNPGTGVVSSFDFTS